MADLKLDIGEGQIQNAIAVAIAESFTGEKRDALLRDIIRAHISYKQNSYDKETLLSKTIGNMVREIAQEAIKKQVDKARPAIEKMVIEHLGPGFEQSICTQLRDGLAYRKVQGISVSVRVSEDE